MSIHYLYEGYISRVSGEGRSYGHFIKFGDGYCLQKSGCTMAFFKEEEEGLRKKIADLRFNGTFYWVTPHDSTRPVLEEETFKITHEELKDRFPILHELIARDQSIIGPQQGTQTGYL